MNEFIAASTNFFLKGNRQVAFLPLQPNGISYGDGFLLPYPQLMGIVENQTVEDTPGGDTLAESISSLKSGTMTLRWPRLNPRQIALMKGSEYIETGSDGNFQIRVKRKLTDVPGEFKIIGRVAYIGKQFPEGDHHLEAYRCSLLTGPSIAYETDKGAIYEATFTILERIDGEFYDLVFNEQGQELTAAVDNTAPTIVAIDPADNASTVALNKNPTVEFSEPINFNPKDFTIQKITSSTVVADHPCTPTISSDKKTVSFNPDTNFTASANHNIHISGDVRDLAANYIAGAVNSQFTTASS